MRSREELTSAQSATAQEFYTWTFPGAPVRVHLYLSVVDHLSREVRRAFESVPSHSVEIGGLLLGTADFASSPVIEIKAFEPFLCEYRSDHKFILSDADRRKLEKLLAAHKSDRQDGLAVVGYYRSHLGEGLQMSPEDLGIAQACFCDPANVFLVVKPAADRSLSAGFFFWDKGRIDSEFTFLEFPFDARLLSAVRVKPTRSGAPEHTPDPAPDAAPSGLAALAHASAEMEPAEFEPGPSRGFRRLWYPLLALLMIALGAIAYQGYQAFRSTGRASAASDGLSLRVERRGADLRVSWNQSSPALAKAQDAVLSIRDGEAQQQTLHLDLDQLRNGSVLYTPANSTVQFRLEVTAGDNSKLSETVLALTAAPPGTVTTTTTPAVTKPAERPSPAAANPAPSTSASRDHKVFTPPRPTSKSGEPVRVVTVDPPAQSPGNAPQNGSAAPPVIPEPKVTAPPAAELPQGAQTSARATYVPPRPIRRPQPVLSAVVANLVAAQVDVDVKVWIDETGRVVRTEALPARRPVSSSLVAAARSAAMQWRFEPARQGNRAVPSDLILRFQYEPAP